MNTKGFSRMLFGEKMPDKNDPQYKEKYERDVNAGRKFAKATRLDKLAAKIQGFANRNKILFLVMVFGFVIGTFTFNIYRLTKAYRHGQEYNQSRTFFPSPYTGSFFPSRIFLMISGISFSGKWYGP